MNIFLKNLILKGIIHGKIFRPRAKTGQNAWLRSDLFYLGKEISKANTKWERIVLYSFNAEVYSPVLEISFNTKDNL